MKTVDTSTVVVGATVTFTLVATNAGPGTASAARITDTLPPGLAPVAASAGCVVAGQIVTCAVGDLAAGQSGTVTVSVRVDCRRKLHQSGNRRIARHRPGLCRQHGERGCRSR